ncbi:MAG: phosphatase PAP2 family protein [Lachnospiraceae bacterium]|nr:phosphatase PAP2 family protein [Lachnospiraceae bacterium]MCI7190168.1 phosphatase PAP2 family protein [Lachnospiraceae bacterium]MDD7628312.1 phosphatase PAP2 family protein [Lachnospiraceae bacterium]MDY4118415.1 phosphatase PAP2 family protein [Lachnospiraceae bacterium]
MKKFYERYKHAIPLFIYAIIYLSWFGYLEKTVKRPANLIHMNLDDKIPFCEVFIVPYLLWFVYISAVVLYFFFKDKQDYYRACTFLFTGMTVFLVVSTLWPNGHHLRPAVMPRDNIFSTMVAMLYKTDTPTNLWPSIHVYNSLGAHFAVFRNEKLHRKPVVHIGSLVLCVSIILSTMFLKQHSVFDVLTAFIMAAVMYIVVYGFDIVTIWQNHRYGVRRRRIRQV